MAVVKEKLQREGSLYTPETTPISPRRMDQAKSSASGDTLVPCESPVCARSGNVPRCFEFQACLCKSLGPGWGGPNNAARIGAPRILSRQKLNGLARNKDPFEFNPCPRLRDVDGPNRLPNLSSLLSHYGYQLKFRLGPMRTPRIWPGGMTIYTEPFHFGLHLFQNTRGEGGEEAPGAPWEPLSPRRDRGTLAAVSLSFLTSPSRRFLTLFVGSLPDCHAQVLFLSSKNLENRAR